MIKRMLAWLRTLSQGGEPVTVEPVRTVPGSTDGPTYMDHIMEHDRIRDTRIENPMVMERCQICGEAPW